MSRRRPWAAIVEALEAEGVEYVFGLPGDPQLLYNDLYESSVRPVLVRMETSAVFMAMAYARVSGRVGVVHASPGPGMANLVPGLLEAQYACSPLVCVVSAAGREHEGSGGFQDAPSLAMVRPVTKWAVRIDLPERTSWTMQRAFAVAQNGKPGPVFVEIPVDVAAAEAEIPGYRRPLVGLRSAGDPAAVEQASRLLAALRAAGDLGRRRRRAVRRRGRARRARGDPRRPGRDDAVRSWLDLGGASPRVRIRRPLSHAVERATRRRVGLRPLRRHAAGGVPDGPRPLPPRDCARDPGRRRPVRDRAQHRSGRRCCGRRDARARATRGLDATRARTTVDGGAGRVQGGVRARRRKRVLPRCTGRYGRSRSCTRSTAPSRTASCSCTRTADRTSGRTTARS